jgi:hypothetical protein
LLFIDSLRLLLIFCATAGIFLLAMAVTLTSGARLKTQQLAMFSYCALTDYSLKVTLNR